MAVNHHHEANTAVKNVFAPPKQPYLDLIERERMEERERDHTFTDSEAKVWLRNHGFDTLFFEEGRQTHAWAEGVRQKKLFEEEYYLNTEEFCPMSYSAETGCLAMMKWLYKNGAEADILLPNIDGNSSFGHACYGGHLECCRWMYSLGSPHFTSEELRRCNHGGTSPFLMASMEGRLHVMKWLHDEIGVVEDVRKLNDAGRSPYNCAARFKHLETCQWLVLNGGLNNNTDYDGHVTYEIVERDSRPDTPSDSELETEEEEEEDDNNDDDDDDDVDEIELQQQPPQIQYHQSESSSDCSKIYRNGFLAESKLAPNDVSSSNSAPLGSGGDDAGIMLHEAVTPRDRSSLASTVTMLPPSIITDLRRNYERMERQEVKKELFSKRMIRWAQQILEVHDIFVNIIVMGSCAAYHQIAKDARDIDIARKRIHWTTRSSSSFELSSTSRRSLPPSPISLLGSLDSDTTRGILQRISDFLGVKTGRQLRNIREFARHIRSAIERRHFARLQAEASKRLMNQVPMRVMSFAAAAVLEDATENEYN